MCKSIIFVAFASIVAVLLISAVENTTHNASVDICRRSALTTEELARC